MGVGWGLQSNGSPFKETHLIPGGEGEGGWRILMYFLALFFSVLKS